MNRFLLIYLAFGGLILFLTACSDNPKTEETKVTVEVANADSAQIAASLHQFFTWYGQTGEQLIHRIDFVNTTGKHPVLNEALLREYLAEFVKSGVVSAEFVADETKFYRACAERWKNELSDEMYSGFVIDRYYCQNDGDVREFLTAPVMFRLHGERAKVRLQLDTKGTNAGLKDFDMIRENGQWKLAKIRCNCGVEY